MDKPSTRDKSVQEDKFLNALADAFRLQEAIINATELPIVATNREGVINSFNTAAENLFGYAATEVIDKSSCLLLHDMDEVVSHVEEMVKLHQVTHEPIFDAFTALARLERKAQRREWKLVKKDKTRFPASVSMHTLEDDNEAVIGFVYVVNNLTELRKTEELAVVNEQKFQLLAENLPGAIYLCENDENYSMVYLNERVKEITGYSAEEFISGAIHFTNLFHPDDKLMIFQKVNEALDKRNSFQLNYRIKNKNGLWRWVDAVGIGVYAGEKLLLIEGFISDTTDQHHAEEKLRKIAEENVQVFNNPVSLNAIAGFDGYFKRLSPSWSNLLGWSTEELMAKPFIDFVHPNDIEATRDATAYIGSGNNLHTFENRYKCKDGSYRWLLWGSAADVGNNLMYASAIDITQRKKSEEALLSSKKNFESIALKLQEQNRQLDEFAHIISHNLRSPVNNIQALIGLLDANSNIDEYKTIFEKITKVSKNLSETMTDLMETLKVKENTAIECIDLRFKEILDKVVQSLEGDLIVAEASVTFNFNAAPVIYYSKPYLESIFQNLLSNAIKYRSSDRVPRIHFETAKVENIIELRVSDNGLGIDMQRFGDKIFGLHKTFHQHNEARGVGLFLIKTQIEALGGSISVESRVNEGTTFLIRFNGND
jgi:PAS domain S-box-containing protein